MCSMIYGGTCGELMEKLGVVTVNIIMKCCKCPSSRIGKPKLLGGRSKKVRGPKYSEQQHNDGCHLGDGGHNHLQQDVRCCLHLPRGPQ
jgi:hypothetical protein